MSNGKMKYLPSFGGGFGINRNVAGDKALTAAEPAMSGVTVRPGSGFSRKAVGRVMSGSHFSGAKIIRGKKS